MSKEFAIVGTLVNLRIVPLEYAEKHNYYIRYKGSNIVCSYKALTTTLNHLKTSPERRDCDDSYRIKKIQKKLDRILKEKPFLGI